VGFNPYRKYRATVTDYVLIALVCAIAVGLLTWAFLG
jgi:energy-coupling factor transporter transmembrane protein EcfT